MSAEIENLLAALDGFRMSDQMDYAAYSQLHDLISELDVAEPSVREWISVKDRLPEKGGTYLCDQSFASSLCRVNTYRWSEKNECFMGHEVGSKIDGVTFWMPLPEPPKEEEHESMERNRP